MILIIWYNDDLGLYMWRVRNSIEHATVECGIATSRDRAWLEAQAAADRFFAEAT